MNTLHTFVYKEKEYALKKPTRMEIDEADMIYSMNISECIKRGILTRDMLAKRYDDFGGHLTNSELKDYKNLMGEFAEVQKELQTVKTKKAKEAAEKKFEEIFSKLQQIQQIEENIFQRTAENIARNKTILWLVFSLAQIKDGDGFEPVYAGVEHEEKYNSYAKQEEEDSDFAQGLLSKFSIYVTYWYTNKADKPEDFKALDDYLKTVEDSEEPSDA